MLEEKSRVLTDLEYLETLISESAPEDLSAQCGSIYNLSIRNIGKIKGTPEDHLKSRYMAIINVLIQYLPEVIEEPVVERSVVLPPSELPNKVGLEASTICQLRCKTCRVQQENCQALGRGYLTFDNFKSFIDNHSYITEIELSNNGEVFLNPELTQII